MVSAFSILDKYSDCYFLACVLFWESNQFHPRYWRVSALDIISPCRCDIWQKILKEPGSVLIFVAFAKQTQIPDIVIKSGCRRSADQRLELLITQSRRGKAWKAKPIPPSTR